MIIPGNGKAKRMAGLLIAVIFLSCIGIFPESVKTVYIPTDIKIEENTAKESLVHSLKDDEIFQVWSLYLIDDSMYLVKLKPIEVLKLDLQGKITGRAGKEGVGPQEFRAVNGLRPYKGNIALLDSKNLKIVLYTKDLKYLNESKLRTQLYNLFIDNRNNFVFYDDPSNTHYFDVYSEQLDFLRIFGETAAPEEDIRKNMLFDSVQCLWYIPLENGLWASFRNRYDLRYYRDEKLALEIKAPEGFFKRQEQKLPNGKLVVMPMDKPTYLAGDGKRVYYFYLKDWKSFCDVFDAQTSRLLRRIKLPHNYLQYAQYKENTFYALYSNEEDELLLVKLEI